MVILGISIGTRTSGIAIVNKRGLIAFHTISFKDSWSEQKGTDIVRKYEKYIKRHAVTVVVLKIPRMSHHTEAISILLKKIKDAVHFQGCMVEYKTQEQLKEAMPQIKNSRDLISHTSTLYPVLLPMQAKELSNKNSYHDKMFEAVLVAHLYKHQQRFPQD